MLVIKDKKEIEENYIPYLQDESKLRGKADKLYFPEEEKELADILREATSSKTPITVSNARTGIVGGSVPEGGILISLEKLKKTIELNNNTLRVSANITLNEIDEFLQKNNSSYFYPIDVTEKSSAIGGNISTNASGGRSFFYGSTRKWIKKIRVILPDGNLIELERGREKLKNYDLNLSDKSLSLNPIKQLSVKNNAGYYIRENMDLIDLFIGSEGTLGIIVDAELFLTEKKEEIISIVVFFETEKDTLNFYNLIKKEENIYCVEHFDRNSLNLLSENFNIPLKGGAIYFEKEIKNFDTDLEILENLLKESNSSIDNSWAGIEEKEKEKIIDFRHYLPELVNNKIAAAKQNYPQIHKLSTDIAVPEKELHKMINFYKENCEKENLNYVLFGHIGESHLHLNIIPENEKEFEKGKILIKEFIKFAVSLNGTFSAEHGVGKLKKEYMKYLYPEKDLTEMKKIKQFLDSNLILNPKNIFEK